MKNCKIVQKTLVILTLTTVAFTAKGQQLAFPGADGYSKYVTGGRGDEVYEVTNLKDDGSAGSGSLPQRNIIIDHCSVSYGCDETLSV